MYCYLNHEFGLLNNLKNLKILKIIYREHANLL